jgi:hypothetical protein
LLTSCERELEDIANQPASKHVFIIESITTLCDKVRQWLVTCRWFSPGNLVSSTNKTDRHDIAEILLKVALNTITLTLFLIILYS